MTDLERLTVRQISRRFLPLLALAYFVAFIDRANVGFASLQMNADLGLSASAYGFGAGLFYLTYALCEVPSNLILSRFGARLWLARIMMSWGVLAAAMALITGPRSFYLMRMLLGAAEAGFFPGVLLFLTHWYPRAYRARIVSLFMVAIPLSSFFGAQMSAALLQLDGAAGLRGWQWLFLIEGAPAVLLGIGTLYVLTDRPAGAHWLTNEQREWLQQQLAAEAASGGAPATVRASVWQLCQRPEVLAAALISAGSAGVSQCLVNWQPQIVKSFGLSITQTGLATAMPYLVASAAMLWWGQRSDRLHERHLHTAIPLALTTLALLSALWLEGLWPTLLLLTVVLVSIYAIKGPFWALCADWVPGADAAAGLALVTAAGAGSAFGASWLFGAIKDATGSYALALQPMAALSALGLLALLLLSSGHSRSQGAAASLRQRT